MSNYLYGASVQGIQEFIFATNKLQEIVGASEIIKGIAKEFIDYSQLPENQILVNAAGNIKAIFTDKTLLEKVVSNFAKNIQQNAYGITISQAVIEIGEEVTQDEINRLEARLKIQRNKPSIALDSSISLMRLSPSTAKAAVESKDGELLSTASLQKRKAYGTFFRQKRKENPEFAELKELSAISNRKNKIAIIHADGNGLGQLIPTLGNKLSDFSKKLDAATKNAFDYASSDIKKIRPIILGGDDMSAICNANDALEFTRKFLHAFETETERLIGRALTACAGIAFCNEKYPFHYAVGLAEELCSATKKHAKSINPTLAPSSLMFHNIQSSNFQSWEKFIEDELSIHNDQRTIDLVFGPYYLSQNDQPKIQDLQNLIHALALEGSPIANLRSWIGELYKDDLMAQKMIERIDDMAGIHKGYKKEPLNNAFKKLNDALSLRSPIINNKTPIYDLLQILSVTEEKA